MQTPGKAFFIASLLAITSTAKASPSLNEVTFKLYSFIEIDPKQCLYRIRAANMERPRIGSAFAVHNSQGIDPEKKLVMTAAHVPYHGNKNFCHVITDGGSYAAQLKLVSVDILKDLASFTFLDSENLPRSIDLANESKLSHQDKLLSAGFPARSTEVRIVSGTVATLTTDHPAFSNVTATEAVLPTVVGMSGGPVVRVTEDQTLRLIGLNSSQALNLETAGIEPQLDNLSKFLEPSTLPQISTMVISQKDIRQFVEASKPLKDSLHFKVNLQIRGVQAIQIEEFLLKELPCRENTHASIGGDFAGIGGDFAGIGGDFAGISPSEACGVLVQKTTVPEDTLTPNSQITDPEDHAIKFLKSISKKHPDGYVIQFAEINGQQERVQSLFQLFGALKSASRVHGESATELVQQEKKQFEVSRFTSQLDAAKDSQNNARVDRVIKVSLDRITSAYSLVNLWKHLSWAQRSKLIEVGQQLIHPTTLKNWRFFELTISFGIMSWLKSTLDIPEGVFTTKNTDIEYSPAGCVFAGSDLNLRKHIELALKLAPQTIFDNDVLQPHERTEAVEFVSKHFRDLSVTFAAYPNKMPRFILDDQNNSITLCQVMRAKWNIESTNIEAKDGMIKRFSIDPTKQLIKLSFKKQTGSCSIRMLDNGALESNGMQTIGETFEKGHYNLYLVRTSQIGHANAKTPTLKVQCIRPEDQSLITISSAEIPRLLSYDVVRDPDAGAIVESAFKIISEVNPSFRKTKTMSADNEAIAALTEALDVWQNIQREKNSRGSR